ncbi:hypothetical protein NKG94_26120 [Micromonospora sp. M12]
MCCGVGVRPGAARVERLPDRQEIGARCPSRCLVTDPWVAVKAGVIALLLFGAVAYAAVGANEETAGPAPSQSPPR